MLSLDMLQSFRNSNTHHCEGSSPQSLHGSIEIHDLMTSMHRFVCACVCQQIVNFYTFMKRKFH